LRSAAVAENDPPPSSTARVDFAAFCGHIGKIFGFRSDTFYLPQQNAMLVTNAMHIGVDDRGWSSELFLRINMAV